MDPIPFGKPLLGDEERDAVMRVLQGTTLVHGPVAKEFENAFARFTGAPHAVSVSSATAALHLCYFYLGLGAGDEVIVPAMTHVATAHAVELVGAKPVFVDAALPSGNIDPRRIEEKVGPRTRAISLVHFLGVPADMEAILAIARRRELFVVEDCALAVGAKVGDTHVGLLGDAGCFSFYPVKHFTTAEGGVLITRHAAVAERIAKQKAFGVDRAVHERKVPGVYDVVDLGFNYRMSELHAAIGVEQLKRLGGFLAARRANFRSLREALTGLEELTVLGNDLTAATSSDYCLEVLLPARLKDRRSAVIAALTARGVGSSVYYPHPVPRLKYYREKYGYRDGECPVAERISDLGIALPVGPHLGPEDPSRIAAALREALAEVGA